MMHTHHCSIDEKFRHDLCEKPKEILRPQGGLVHSKSPFYRVRQFKVNVQYNLATKRRWGELVFSKTFCRTIINLQLNSKVIK